MEKYVFLYNGNGWYLTIPSPDVLNTYLDMVWNIREEELAEHQKRIEKGLHPAGDVGNICHVLAKVKGTTIHEEYQSLKNKQVQQMSKMMEQGMTLYVNRVGGYTFTLDDVINRYESETLMWPVWNKEDIRIKQWPGGTHYYAYIGPIQVKESGIVKWDTMDDAHAAAMKYVGKK